jgi:hypothetical protein
MEPIVQEMRDMGFNLSRTADSHIQIRKGHRFVDAENREKAKTLLLQFQQGYPSNQELKGYKIGPRFTWNRLKHLAETIFSYL